MFQKFIETFKSNLATSLAKTIGVIAGLILSVLVMWIILNQAFWIGVWGGVLAAILVAAIAYRMPALAWFWGRPVPEKTPEPEEKISTPVAAKTSREDSPETTVSYSDRYRGLFGTMTPRASPVGTQLLKQTHDKAVMEIRAAIRFWCWALPIAMVVAAVIALPFGGIWGAQLYAENYDRAVWKGGASQVASMPVYIIWGALLFAAVFCALAIASYVLTRPKVQVAVSDDIIKFGSYRFDRKYAAGARVGYTSNETNLRSSFLQPRFGVVALRFAYGRWGEDTKYLVDAHHAEDIVIWMNEIIDSIGEDHVARNDPYAGRKIELL
ncbi:hypothetical protein [Celeribacter sp.]|uniref:hypothetical protein n=1 Tax=Celeribacter sp. TaxID=1890673 RepID=UPI003A8E6FA4